ncbi:MAG: head-tail connector protein [Holosporaceae bacterium]|jgi:hypothetical protein|nr:head-tail connector protein [Holosporaceae bacterium]
MQLNLIEPPKSEIITTEEAKNYLRIDHDFDDDLIRSFIKATRQAIESIIQKSVMKQTWEYVLDNTSVCKFDFGESDYPSIFSDSLRVPLPKPPVMKILSVRMNKGEINPDRCTLDLINGKYCLCISGKRLFCDNRKISLSVRYEAGIADRAENVPYQLKLANLMLTANAFRERCSCGDEGFISKGVRQLLSPFLNMRVF